MRKILNLIYVVLIFNISAFTLDYEICQDTDTKKYGYCEDGKTIIPRIYDKVYDFCDEGITAVEKDEKYGFIDTKGNQITPIIYENIYPCPYENLIPVELNGKWGYINTKGETIIEFQYDDAKGFTDGIGGVKRNDKWGGIDKNEKEIISFNYDDIEVYFDDIIIVKKGNKWGAINKEGEEIYPFICNKIQKENGILECITYNLYIFLPKEKKLVELKNYEYAEVVDRDISLIKVGLNHKYGFIDVTGKEVIPVKYDYVGSFSEGFAMVKLNGKWGIIDKTGKEVIPVKYDYVYSFSEGFAGVKLNGKWGIIDKTGKEVIPVKYDDVDSFSEGLARVKLNDKWGFIDKSGKEVIPVKYDYVYSFSEGLAEVKLNGKYGFVDKTGKEVIPVKYDYVYSFREGFAMVGINDKYGFIDKTGNEVVPIDYNFHFNYEETEEKHFKNYHYLRSDYKYGLILSQDEYILPKLEEKEIDLIIKKLNSLYEYETNIKTCEEKLDILSKSVELTKQISYIPQELKDLKSRYDEKIVSIKISKKDKVYEVDISYRNKFAKEVKISGSFWQWKQRNMEKDGDIWRYRIVVRGPGLYNYYFIVDDKKTLPPDAKKDATGNFLILEVK